MGPDTLIRQLPPKKCLAGTYLLFWLQPYTFSSFHMSVTVVTRHVQFGLLQIQFPQNFCKTVIWTDLKCQIIIRMNWSEFRYECFCFFVSFLSVGSVWKVWTNLVPNWFIIFWQKWYQTGPKTNQYRYRIGQNQCKICKYSNQILDCCTCLVVTRIQKVDESYQWSHRQKWIFNRGSNSSRISPKLKEMIFKNK